MAGILAAALEMARRGWRVFPLEPNGKTPVIPSFMTYATTDPMLIRAWWVDPVTGVEREYNYGVLCTDSVVVDVDVKGGKPGLQNYLALGGHFDTFTVETPTGGFHCYFMGPDSSLAPLAAGLDVRSHNGFVVGPGSVIDGRLYRVLYDLEPQWVPVDIEARLRPPGRRDPRLDEGVELDSPNNLTHAREYLRSRAPVAVEGQGGDQTTFTVAAALVRDYALSEYTAWQMLADEWNPRCEPPWDLEDLLVKVENAANYGTRALGAALPDAQFGSVQIPPPPEPLHERQGVVFGNAVHPTAIPPRAWLAEPLLAYKQLTVIPAAGATGKSLFTLTLAAHFVQGLAFDDFVPKHPTKWVVYNAEDDIDEQSRRLYAICQFYKFDYELVRSRIMLLSVDEIPLNLASRVGGQLIRNEEHVQSLVALASAPDVGVLALDPLVDLHSCDENDTTQMRFVMSVLSDIARAANVALLLPHHAGKGKAGGAGDVDIARGSSAITSKARIVLTMTTATDADCQEYGIAEHEKTRYVRIDGAKMNQTLRRPVPVWFRWETEKLFTGDKVGILSSVDMAEHAASAVRALGDALIDHMMLNGSGSIAVTDAKHILMSIDPLYAKLAPGVVNSRIERMFVAGVDCDNGHLRLSRKEGKAMIVLE